LEKPEKRLKPAGRARGFELQLDIAGPAAGLPTFLRIARAITRDIRRGRLAPGTRLPGSRVLAQSLCVHRNTVLAAFRELLSEGWIEARHGRGTFVSEQLPEVSGRGFGRSKRDAAGSAGARAEPRTVAAQPPGFDVARVTHVTLSRTYPAHVLRLFGGLPDLRLLPRDALARAQRRVMRRHFEALSYGDGAGHPQLRAAIAGMLRETRALSVGPDDIFVTRGSQMALALIAQCLLGPDDTVAVEGLGYSPAWAALRHTGAQLLPVAVDADGLCVAELAALCEKRAIRAVYLTPHHQYPTTVPLSPARRLELLALAERKRLAIIEDDYDHEYHYEGRPLLPLKSADYAGNVVYVGTFSKVFAPGIRMGYAVAPPVLREEMAARRAYIDRQGDPVTELALAELIEDGELARHTRRTRRIYEQRRALFVELLRRQLGQVLSFEVPSGGMALWAHASGVDVPRWLAASERLGVAFQAGTQFCFDGGPSQSLRLGFACLNEAELQEAVLRMRKALASAR
jgi:GntR family transcriptional regulator/MocR family aminotransferase